MQPILKYFYTLGSGQKTFPLSQYKQQPNCGLSFETFDAVVLNQTEFLFNVSAFGIQIDQDYSDKYEGKTLIWQILASVGEQINTKGLVEITLLKDNLKTTNKINGDAALNGKSQTELQIKALSIDRYGLV